MSALSKRLRTLESREPTTLSPAVRAWLGEPITAAEQRAIEDCADLGATDRAGFTAEMVAWLDQR